MNKQYGGTFFGIVIGLMIGLALALIVAVFISKVPVPFLVKDPSQQGLSEAAEAKKNQGWNPNAPLAGKNPARPASASGVASAAAALVPVAATSATPPAAKSADPIADLARAKSSASPADPFLYFIQVGAFRSAEDANAQKVKLSLLGIETKVSEREQSGRAVFRVRAGPFEQREEAEKARERVEGASFEAVLVRVQR